AVYRGRSLAAKQPRRVQHKLPRLGMKNGVYHPEIGTYGPQLIQIKPGGGCCTRRYLSRTSTTSERPNEACGLPRAEPGRGGRSPGSQAEGGHPEQHSPPPPWTDRCHPGPH
ncbi:Hypothetical predicted protein, partial [Pelobates cultripes]